MHLLYVLFYPLPSYPLSPLPPHRRPPPRYLARKDQRPVTMNDEEVALVYSAKQVHQRCTCARSTMHEVKQEQLLWRGGCLVSTANAPCMKTSSGTINSECHSATTTPPNETTLNTNWVTVIPTVYSEPTHLSSFFLSIDTTISQIS